MIVVWDEPKRLMNLKTREMDFAALDVEFFASSTIVGAKNGRYKAVGEFDGAIIAVIFKPPGTEAVSVISMRRASRKERSL